MERLEDELEEVKQKNRILEGETEKNRRFQLQNSRLSDAGSHLNF